MKCTATALLHATVKARAIQKEHARATRLITETTASTFSVLPARRTVFATILLVTATALNITTATIATFSAILRPCAEFTASAEQMANVFAEKVITDLDATIVVPLRTANMVIATRL